MSKEMQCFYFILANRPADESAPSDNGWSTIWGYMLECSSSNSCKETRIKIILRIYTTGEKLNKINNVAAPGCLEKKGKKKKQLFCADITDVLGMDLVRARWIRERIC